MPQINVAPARDGILVPRERGGGGQFIGMRLARPGDPAEAIVSASERSLGYVKAEPPYAVVEASPYYTRCVMRGELVQLSADDVAKLIAAQHAREAVAPVADETTHAAAKSRSRSV
jgi:hypothetical protein